MLHHEARGAGPDLVMVHGWGMHSGVWSEWADALAGCFRVHLVDLPGHGRSDFTAGCSLDDWSTALAEVVPDGAFALGWSLGGLVTQNLARLAPQKLRALVLVASTPRFVRAPDWPCAVEGEVFSRFAAELEQSVERTLARFLSLQVRGAEGGGDLLRRLRARLKARPYPQPAALRAGLRMLEDGDLRGLPAAGASPYWLFGERDTLVPLAVRDRVPGQFRVIAGAGHAPFLSHPRECADCVGAWLEQAEAGAGCHAGD